MLSRVTTSPGRFGSRPTRLVAWMGKQAVRRTFASIADDTGLDEKTIRNIFRDYINELEAEFRFETPKWMGIDEIHIINKPRCVVSNIQNIEPARSKRPFRQ